MKRLVVVTVQDLPNGRVYETRMVFEDEKPKTRARAIESAAGYMARTMLGLKTEAKDGGRE